MTPLSRLFAKVEIRFGFMETPNIPRALALAPPHPAPPPGESEVEGT
jgi:K+ transporter